MKHWMFRATTLMVAIALAEPALAASCEGKSYTISFSEFPVGTAITTNYADKGLLFASGAFITDDGANPTSPVLSATPKFQGSVTGAFVDPNDSSKNATVKWLSFDAGYFDDLGSTEVVFSQYQ